MWSYNVSYFRIKYIESKDCRKPKVCNRCNTKAKFRNTHERKQAISSGSSQAMQSPFSPIQVKAKLSKLTLPKCRGDMTKWRSFWDSFKSAIHENNRMSKVDINFNYLNSLLEASASRSIQGPVSSPIPTTIQRLKFSRKIRQISTNNLGTYGWALETS